ncbi:V-type ATPase subunit [Patescibacteria group bacterium]|nr:V-type ATPase subunit [Patescibacteria group bacterium]
MLASNYAFATGKIRALEPHILDATDVERMVSAPDFETAFKVLNDTDYADNLLDIQPINYRDALRADYKQLYRMLKKIIPDQNFFKFLYLKRDFLNLRILFKAKYHNINEVDEMLDHETVYQPEHLKEFVLNKIDLGLDDDIKKVILKADRKFALRSEPDYIDSRLTYLLFELEGKLIKKIKNKFVTGLYKLLIDQANILSFLRATRLKLSKDRLKQNLIYGGNIEASDLEEVYGKSNEELMKILGKQYDKIVSEQCDKYCQSDLLYIFEKSLEDFLIRYLQKAKSIAYGPEIVLAYYFAKRNAVRNIRIIMTGKLNDMPVEEIKTTLRQTY